MQKKSVNKVKIPYFECNYYHKQAQKRFYIQHVIRFKEKNKYICSENTNKKVTT